MKELKEERVINS